MNPEMRRRIINELRTMISLAIIFYLVGMILGTYWHVVAKTESIETDQLKVIVALWLVYIAVKIAP